MSRRRKLRPLRQRILRWVVLLLGLVVLATWIPVIWLRWSDPSVTAFMLSQHWNQEREIYYQWMDWPLLGKQAALAVMAAEDQRFPEHRGFDIASIKNAVQTRRDGGRLRGASTISQQTVKNIFLWPGRSWLRKGFEAYFTVLIELFWPKRRILEVYLNIVELGPAIYGVPAASRVYFDKTPQQLDAYEAALLAAVLPNPKRLHVTRPSAYVRERQQWIRAQAVRLARDSYLQRIEP